MKAQHPLMPLVELPRRAYMTGVAIGTGCGTLAVLVLLGMLNV